MAKRKSGDIHSERENRPKRPKWEQKELPIDQALQKLPKPTRTLSGIGHYTRITVTDSHVTPALPVIKDERLATTPFRHISVSNDTSSYDQLEFLGDAYIELFASRLLFHRFAAEISPSQVIRLFQMREVLVSNETLSRIAKGYGFEGKLQIQGREALEKETQKSNKGLNKVLADCVEAYVAAIILDDPEAGFETAERWLATLWEKKVEEMVGRYQVRDCYTPLGTCHDDHYHQKALEFLGGAYVELFATRLVFARFENLPAGRMSQLTEKLIKNDSLGSLACELDLPGASRERAGRERDDAIIFKAHIATCILREESQAAGEEKRCERLWAARLLDQINYDQSIIPPDKDASSQTAMELKKVYNPEGKAVLQKRILSPSIRLQYEKFQDSIELTGARLGQSRHFIALYLTGYGYERKIIGNGEGKSKAEAGNWAAIDAMYGDAKEIIDDCEQKRLQERARKQTPIRPPPIANLDMPGKETSAI